MVDVAGDEGVQLATIFVGAVGRERAFRCGLGDRQVGAVAIDRGGGGVDHGRWRSQAAHLVEQRDGAGEVDAVDAHPILHPALDRGDGSKVKTAIDPGDGGLHGERVGDVAFDQLGVCRQVGAVAGGQVVEHADGVAVGDEGMAKMRADEAGAAGDEVCGAGHAAGLARIGLRRQRRLGGVRCFGL